MDMCSSAGVMPRKEGVELDYAVGVSLLDASAVGGLDAALTGRGDPAVDACGVAMPYVD